MRDTQDAETALRSFIMEAVREEADPGTAINGDTVLLGRGAVISSLGLVGVLVRLEDYCLERELPFSWTMDAAMSAKNSPFRTVNALAAFAARAAAEGTGE